MNERAIYKWYKRFQGGRESVEDDDRVGRPRTSITEKNAEEVKEKILDNRRITIRDVAEEVDLNWKILQ